MRARAPLSFSLLLLALFASGPVGAFGTSGPNASHPACPLDSQGRACLAKDDSLATLSLRCFGTLRAVPALRARNSLSETAPTALSPGRCFFLPPEFSRVSAAKGWEAERRYWEKVIAARAAPEETAGASPLLAEPQLLAELKRLEAPETSPEERRQKLAETQRHLQAAPRELNLRIQEIRLLFLTHRPEEATERAQALLRDHPELASFQPFRSWAKIPEIER